MSLVSFALRQATVMALKGRTFAGSHVFDSAIGSLEAVAEGATTPVIVVYVDEERAGKIDGRDLLAGDRVLDLVLEIIIFGRQAADADGEVYAIPHTDEGLEVSLDLMVRAIHRGLLADDGVWPELWRNFVFGVEKVGVRRAADTKDGVRFAARQLVLSCFALAEPGFGAAVAGPWEKLLTAMRAESGMAPLADVIGQAIAGGPMSGWRQAQAALALTREGVRGIGLAPFDATETGEAPPLDIITLDPLGLASTDAAGGA